MPGPGRDDVDTAALPARGEFVLRGGRVMTMDPALGTVDVGDVHVRDGVIMAIGASLPVTAAEAIDARGMIVMPGFVETHWHLWNAIYRNLITAQGHYLAVKHELAPFHSALDFHRSTRLAMLEALDAGITTVHNFAHNVVDSEFADAEIEAMVGSGLRGRYSYGWPDALPSDKVMPLADVERVQRTWGGPANPSDGRLTFGLVARGPQYTERAIWRQELGRGQELGLPLAIHAGPFARPVSAVELRAEGFLDANMMLIQFQRATAADRQAMLETGAWNSLGALLLHLRGPIEADVQNLVRMVYEGVNTCLSIDSTPISTVNMFEVMRALWQLGVPAGRSHHAPPAATGAHREEGHGHPAQGHSAERDAPANDRPDVGAITLRRCLEMATIDGARALGLDRLTGSLTVGKRADIVLVRETDLNMAPPADPEVALVCSATIANVDTVVADGRILKAGGRIVGLDVETAKAEAAESLRAIRQRAGGRWAQDADVGGSDR